jgi:hypothetical protein
MATLFASLVAYASTISASRQGMGEDARVPMGEGYVIQLVRDSPFPPLTALCWEHGHRVGRSHRGRAQGERARVRIRALSLRGA